MFFELFFIFSRKTHFPLLKESSLTKYYCIRSKLTVFKSFLRSPLSLKELILQRQITLHKIKLQPQSILKILFSSLKGPSLGSDYV